VQSIGPRPSCPHPSTRPQPFLSRYVVSSFAWNGGGCALSLILSACLYYEPGAETKPHGRVPVCCSSPRGWVARPGAHQIRPLASAVATCLDRRTCPCAAGGGVQLVSAGHSWLATGRMLV
jgi:hypothetical protein